MNQSIALVSLVVRDYDEAIQFYVGKLGFILAEDTNVPEQGKRWVVVAPPGASESRLLLARASDPEQERCIGTQTGGRVFVFLYTDDFWREEVNRLPEHRGLRLDATDAPADDAEAVDHRRVRVGADQRVGIVE